MAAPNVFYVFQQFTHLAASATLIFSSMKRTSISAPQRWPVLARLMVSMRGFRPHRLTPPTGSRARRVHGLEEVHVSEAVEAGRSSHGHVSTVHDIDVNAHEDAGAAVRGAFQGFGYHIGDAAASDLLRVDHSGRQSVSHLPLVEGDVAVRADPYQVLRVDGP